MNRYDKKTLAREGLVVLAALLLMLPFYFLVNTALKSDVDALNTSAMALPPQLSMEGIEAAWSGSPTRNIPAGVLNSIIITGGSLLTLIAFGSIAAYTITRIPGRITGLLYGMFVLGIILPFQLGMVPIYVVMRNFGLVGTHLGMILLYSGLLMPLSVFLYTGFTKALPREYEEAAQMDGSTPFQTFRRIVFPLLSPATGTVAILCGMIIWNDFFTSLIFLSGSQNAPLPVVVYGFVGEQVSKWNVIFGAVILSMIPILAFYLVAQKKFIQGFAGGIKS
ncbi:Carbohydrate ABC transporter membrane protein 2, CUT1 family [Arthrobacter sp. 9AX]|uniref:carbohydrate ABC transporter permease n=1 Tax=Arthrobacter sp. 9AX TaxID=2653131 RepID=UPI0012F3422F|nr:carbohydrate ABC transporter permease [Arthrobacter sp. 9AX]VXC24336.1 Carbohydrate ABC transporter membrane protein 2, CUT1 family [Arthrobacter sp. 9AX]